MYAIEDFATTNIEAQRHGGAAIADPKPDALESAKRWAATLGSQ
jgi:hypothetical protein